MAERVKQHYVPQFHFRNFTEDERVCCYNINNEHGYPPTPISNICYESHFYDDDGELEETLSRLESELASVVHNIVDDQSLNPIEEDPKSKFYLDLFLTHTHSRTKAAREESYGDAGRFIEKVPALRELRLGTEAVEIDDRIAPVGDERVILKKYASAFFGTDLQTELTTHCVDTLVLAGVTTSGCIRATAVDSLQHGYRTIVPADAVGDRAEGPHRANLFDIDAKYGDVVATDDVLEHLSDNGQR